MKLGTINEPIQAFLSAFESGRNGNVGLVLLVRCH
jgi:hypothetical protein